MRLTVTPVPAIRGRPPRISGERIIKLPMSVIVCISAVPFLGRKIRKNSGQDNEEDIIVSSHRVIENKSKITQSLNGSILRSALLTFVPSFLLWLDSGP